MNQDPFKDYIRESEPGKRDKGYAWHTAIGLQAVNGLKTSEYLLKTAVRNIEDEISFEEASALLQTYYEENPSHDTDDRIEEADKVSVRIAALLSEKALSFTPNEFLSIHRKLFTGIYPHAGRIRDYNITKKEWIELKQHLLPGLPFHGTILEFVLEPEKNDWNHCVIRQYSGLYFVQILQNISTIPMCYADSSKSSSMGFKRP